MENTKQGSMIGRANWAEPIEGKLIEEVEGFERVIYFLLDLISLADRSGFGTETWSVSLTIYEYRRGMR